MTRKQYELTYSLIDISRTLVHTTIAGGNSRGETPVPIPNTEVKTSNAKNTSLETNWKYR